MILFRRYLKRTLKDNSGISSTAIILILFVAFSVAILGVLVVMFMMQKLEKSYSDSQIILPAVPAVTESYQDTEILSESVTDSLQTDYVKPDTEGIVLIDGDFYTEYISEELADRITGYSYNSNSPVELEDLRYVHILYSGVDETAKAGELIVHKAIAQDIAEIFYELFLAGYLIEQVSLVDDFGADDNASMIVNNTSAYNARMISGTERLSMHAYGLAVDVNPLYNPYVASKDDVLPVTARNYVDRNSDFQMKIDEDDLCYRLFTNHGFTWGGSWDTVKDYMHFEKALATIVTE